MFRIDPASSTPPSEQLRAGVTEQVRGGALAAGTRLPTVRALAEELALAPNTVAKAYRQLETDGIIETRGRNGSFVRAQGDRRERELQDLAVAYAARAQTLGIPPEQALAYVETALRRTADF